MLQQSSTSLTNRDWTQAKAHFDRVHGRYRELFGQPGVMTGPALMVVFEPILRRWNAGERTQQLYEEMMAVE